MILTVTLNPAIDRVLVVDAFRPGEDIPARQAVTCVGGKGLDSSVALRGLGVETTGLALLAGDNGQALQRILQSYGIVPAPIWVDGETRVCTVISERESGAVTHIKQGAIALQPHHHNQIFDLFEELLSTAQGVICAGSLPRSAPQGIYAELITRARRKAVFTLLDCSGEAFIAGIRAKPGVAKCNRDEFAATFGLDRSTPGEMAGPARQVAADFGLEILLITCGADGILAVTPAGAAIARAPVQPVVNAAGAGDAVSAAFCWRLAAGDSFSEALRYAAAAGAAAVLTTATGECRLEDVQRLLPAVELRWLKR